MRRRWLPILVTLDAVLVAGLLVTVLLVVRPAGPAAQAPPGTATTTQAATTPRTTPTPGPPTFQLPSGNIACAMTTDKVTCTIANKTFAPPPRTDCKDDTGGHTVVLGANGVAVPCTDAARPGAEVPTLNYGGKSTVGPYVCTSATNGVTCVDASGKGFRLAREALTMLP